MVIRDYTFLALLLLGGCQSVPPGPTTETYRWAETDLGGHAAGSAYAGAAMYPRRRMPDHRDFGDWEFFFKHCSRVAPDRPWVSKTQYDCNGPY